MHERFTALGYRVHLAEDDGVWIATARRLDSGDASGPPFPGDRADEAADALACWLEWQRAHSRALRALPAAESTYHRPSSASARRIGAAGAHRSATCWSGSTICAAISIPSRNRSHGHIEP